MSASPTDAIEAVIAAILDDPAMPEHMVTKQDDEEMRALLVRHLTPLAPLADAARRALADAWDDGYHVPEGYHAENPYRTEAHQ